MGRFELPDYSSVLGNLPPMPDVPPLEAYSSGFVGTYYDPEAHEELEDSVVSAGGKFAAEDVTSDFAGQGTGKTILLWPEVYKAWPNCKIGYPNQLEGSCVAHASSKAVGISLIVAAVHGDGGIPETGGIENTMWPFSIVPHYAFRSNAPRGDGWYAGASLKAMREKVGLVVCRDYSNIEGGMNLAEYRKGDAHRLSSHNFPAKFLDEIDDHKLGTVAECKSFDEIATMLSAGYAVQTDGGQGFANTTDENGVARRSGSWSHSMSVIGSIDSDAFKQKYGCPGIVIQNSWGSWVKHHPNANVAGQKLPAGAFVALWNDVKNRSYFAVSNTTSWANRKLPDWNLQALIAVMLMVLLP